MKEGSAIEIHGYEKVMVKKAAINYQLNEAGFITTETPLGCERSNAGYKVLLGIGWKGRRGLPGARYMFAFVCGRIQLDNDFNIVKGLTKNGAALLQYTRFAYTDAFAVIKGKDCFDCICPHDYGNQIVRRLARIERATDIQRRGDQHQSTIILPKSWTVIEDYGKHYKFYTSSDKFIKAAGLNKLQAQKFCTLEQPAILVAFGKPISIFKSLDTFNEDIILEDANVHKLITRKFSILKKDFLCRKGKRRPRITASEKIPFVRNGGRVRPGGAKTCHGSWETKQDRRNDLALHTLTKGVKLPKGCIKPGNERLGWMLKHQYAWFKDGLYRQKGSFDGIPYEGLRVTCKHYGAFWAQHDFAGALVFLAFNEIELAKEIMLTALRFYTVEKGEDRGVIGYCKDPDGQILKERNFVTSHPAWCDVCWKIYLECRDKKWLKEVFFFLELNNAHWDRARKSKEGLYYFKTEGKRAAHKWFVDSVSWNDYDYGPGLLKNVRPIGLNSLRYADKKALEFLSGELGYRTKSEKYRNEAQRLKEQINRLFWDEDAGFYFDYDAQRKAIYELPNPDLFKQRHYYGLTNLLPLYAGIATEQQATRLARVMKDTHMYGRFKAITSGLTMAFEDERQFRIWTYTNWMVLQGLKKYGFKKQAFELAWNLLEISFDVWYKNHLFPECFDATHAYLGEEGQYPTIHVGGAFGPIFWIKEVARFIKKGG